MHRSFECGSCSVGWWMGLSLLEAFSSTTFGLFRDTRVVDGGFESSGGTIDVMGYKDRQGHKLLERNDGKEKDSNAQGIVSCRIREKKCEEAV
jgi:hypothetical protein